jgi:hypothetical protein
MSYWKPGLNVEFCYPGYRTYFHSVLLFLKIAILITGCEGPYGCGTSRLPYFLDNRLTDGGEGVSFTRRPPFTPQEDSWYSFLL